MAYNHPDHQHPKTATDNDLVWQYIRHNWQAVTHGLLAGVWPGWDGAPVVGSGTAQQPDEFIYTNNETSGGTTQKVKVEYTYGTSGAEEGAVTQMIISFTGDNETTWDVISTADFTYSEVGAVPSVTWTKGPV